MRMQAGTAGGDEGEEKGGFQRRGYVIRPTDEVVRILLLHVPQPQPLSLWGVI